MAKMGLDKTAVIEQAACLANEIGLESISMKLLADSLGIRSPSLYNHISSLEELKKELMLYGWKQAENKLVCAAEGKEGFDAIREMCRAFYFFASDNKGIFGAMLWYNKYSDESSMSATNGLFSAIYQNMEIEGISREKAEHLIRTMRGFLEGFSLLVNNGAFGHPANITESFEISLDVLIEGMKAAENKKEMSNLNYTMLKKEDIAASLFSDFRRHQKVTKCMRKIDGKWVEIDNPFIEDWGEKEFENLTECLKSTIDTGGVVFGAFEGSRLVGFASAESSFFGSKKQYLELSSIHVSEDLRGNGIGKRLFGLIADWAKKKGGEKLYISSHSSVESQRFYKAMGCTEAEEYSSYHTEKEPFDCQLEYKL